MRLAIQLGVSPRRLWGWEPKKTALYDGDRLVGFATEAEFSHEDLAMLHAARHIDRETTANGFKYTDEISPEADPANRKGKFYFRVANDGAPVVNYAERARQTAITAYKAKHKDAVMDGLIWQVEKVDRL